MGTLNEIKYGDDVQAKFKFYATLNGSNVWVQKGMTGQVERIQRDATVKSCDLLHVYIPELDKTILEYRSMFEPVKLTVKETLAGNYYIAYP